MHILLDISALDFGLNLNYGIEQLDLAIDDSQNLFKVVKVIDVSFCTRIKQKFMKYQYDQLFTSQNLVFRWFCPQQSVLTKFRCGFDQVVGNQLLRFDLFFYLGKQTLNSLFETTFFELSLVLIHPVATFPFTSIFAKS